jgi:predicted Zn-dependent peptidase
MSLVAGVALAVFAHPALARPVQATATPAPRPAPVSQLVAAIDIPYEQFTLGNGLRVIVHTDRKAPVVAVSVWYDVGSKNEPKGKTGFAHLFEHLMFNGTENIPGDFFEPLKRIGATDLNGTTYFDRTNYFETVPTGAVATALYMESDRMGYLGGAITQAVLDEQRGVVQNEKRQGDNQPYGLVQYAQLDGLFPAGHPYGHTPIGSMADLDGASLADVKGWFHDHYGPNNAVLVLAGDIDVATARPLVEKYFGAIPRGPQNTKPVAPVPTTLPGPASMVIKDRVAATRVMRGWAIPGINDKDAAALNVAAGVLGGLASSRFDNILVKRDRVATSASAEITSLSQLGMFDVSMDLRDGVAPATAIARMDATIADLLKNGPTKDEIDRYVTSYVAGRMRRLETVGGFGGKAVSLAEGALYSNDPGFYKKQLAALAAQTPASVKAAMNRWLARPGFTLTVENGPREAYANAAAAPAAPVVAAKDAAPAVKGTRAPMPAVGPAAELKMPAVQRARLSNGIELIYAQRSVVPTTTALLSIDAGTAAEREDRPGTQPLTLAMMNEGTGTLYSTSLAEAKERLGARIGFASGADRTQVSLYVPSANLAAAAGLWAGVARAPSFPASELPRLKTQQLADIAQEQTQPFALLERVLPDLVAPGSPYAIAHGSGDAPVVRALTRDDLIAYQQAWIRPEKAKIFVISDRPLAEVRAIMEQRFGDWRGVGTPGTKPLPPATPTVSARIALIDRPDSPQSVIGGGAQSGLTGVMNVLPVNIGNDALGGDFLGRLNMDLREDKHWSYGVSGYFDIAEHAAPYLVYSSVQADKTGAAIAALRDDIAGYVGARPMTEAEFRRAVAGAALELPGLYESSEAVLSAMQSNDLYKRPDDYQTTLAQRYRAMTLEQANAAMKAAIDPAKFVWAVVGDAGTVRPQLDALGLPVEVVPAAAVAGTAIK